MLFKCEDVVQGDRLLVTRSSNTCFCEGKEYEIVFYKLSNWRVMCECSAAVDYDYLAKDCEDDVQFELVKEAVPW